MPATKRKSKSRKGTRAEDNKRARNKKRVYSAVLIVVCVIIGLGIVIDNISEIYMRDKNTATVSTPLKVMQGRENTFLVTTYSADGVPAGELPVKVDLKYEDETYHLYSGETDSSGSTQPVFTVPELGNEGEKAQLIITAGSEEIRKQVELEAPIKVFISTDKPIYQPSQMVHIRVLSFEEGVPVTGEDTVQVEVQAPDGNKIFRKAYTPNEFGIISLDFPLSDQLPLGDYKIIAAAKGAIAQKNILVKRYVLPKIKIEIKDIKSWYTIDENIIGNVTCKYFFGKDVEGDVKIDIRSYYGVWETIKSVDGKLKNGKFSFFFDPVEYAVGIPYYADNGFLEFNVTVTDTGGHKETKSKMIPIARKPILVTLLADSNVVGTTSNHYLVARYPDGAPVKNAQVRFWADDRSRSLSSWNRPTTNTDSRGVANVAFLYDNQRYFHVEISDNKTTVIETYRTSGTEGLKVIPDKAYYDVGELARMEVVYSGSKAATKWIYYDAVSRGFVVTTGRMKLDDNNKASFTLPITEDLAPLAEIRVYKTQKDLNVAHDVALFGVGTAATGLNVTIDTDKELYLPNDSITFQFTVTDEGAPIQAALGIAGVDQSVFEIHERFTGLEKVLQDLEDEFITPQYQICNYVYSPDSPSGAIPEETESVVSKKKLSTTGGSAMLVLAGTSHLDYADQLEDYYGTYYWFILAFLGLLGYLGLFILALKYKTAAVLAMVLLILLPIVMTAGMIVYYITQEINTLGGGNGGGSVGLTDSGTEATELRQDEWDDQNRPDSSKEASDSGALSTMGGGVGGIDGELPELPDESSGYTDAGGPETNGGAKSMQIRQYFPETWYWNPSLITDGTGKASLSLTTPDSITTWNVEAVASTKDERFGLGTKNVTVFKGFFIEPDLPVSVVRNDEFQLKILIYNYEPDPSNITVTLHPANWYDLLSNSTTATKFVNASSVSSVEFQIQAKEVGTFKLTVDGDNGKKIDRVIKDMRVDPDGKPIEELINGGLDNDQTVEATISLNSDRIPNSTNAYVKLQGGLEAVTLDGAENFIDYVSGCGEQSTSMLSVDIAAYKNLLKGDMTDEQMLKYENMIIQGIQHELMYLVDVPLFGGKAIVWHQGESPDLWLTAWAAFAFQDLEDAGFEVDERILDGFQKYLADNRKSDGSYSFPNVGHWSINSDLQNEKVVATAYITRALLYSGYSKDSKTVQKSIDYLEKKVDLNDNAFTTALVLITLEMGGGSKSIRDALASNLEAKKVADPTLNTVSWDYDKSTGWRDDWYDTRSIETTGYAIMALHKHGGYGSIVNQAIKFLVTNRRGSGWGSTHDTAVAFQALNSIDEISIDDLTVSVFAETEKITSIHFTEYNQDITYYIDLRPHINSSTRQLDITLESEGEGSMLYQIYSEQYLEWAKSELQQPPELELKIKYDTTKIQVNDKITASVYMKYNGASSILKMVLIDLRAPVGFSFIEADFSDLFMDGVINNYEIRGRQALVYVDDIVKGNEYTFSYSLLANRPIRGTIQGVHAYDMYNPNIDTELGPVEVESFA